MKCRFLTEKEINPKTAPADLLKESFKKLKPNGEPYREKDGTERRFVPAGTVYETPRAAFFVLNGDAEPADLECEAAVCKTPEELKDLQHRQRRLSAGIRPEDFPLFDAGVIVGYEADGETYKPGPNWDEYQAKQAAEAAKDDLD